MLASVASVLSATLAVTSRLQSSHANLGRFFGFAAFAFLYSLLCPFFGYTRSYHARFSKEGHSSNEHPIPKIVHDPASRVERRRSDCRLSSGRFCSLL